MADKPIYITPDGLEKLRKELEHLWKVERPKVTREVSDAAALGDRSENAEYIYGKRRLREIDRRLEFLSKRIDSLTVVDPRLVADKDRAGFGAWVRIEDEDGHEHEYRLVGSDESDAESGRISVESPVGRALIGKSIGDEVEVRRPKGVTWLTVIGIRYV